MWFCLYVLIQPVDRKIFEERVFPREYSVMIYTDGNHYYAKDQMGNTICQDSPTSCIQEGINYVFQRGGGIVFIKNGTYPIVDLNNVGYGILMKSNVTLVGEDGATIFADSVGDISKYHSVIFMDNVDNIAIRNLKIKIAKQGWYAGIYFWAGLRNAVFDSLEITSDVGWYAYQNNFVVAIRGVVSNNDTYRIRIKNSYIYNTGYGISIGFANIATSGSIKDVIIENNVVDLNQTTPVGTNGIAIGGRSDIIGENIIVKNNVVKRVGDAGIEIAYAKNAIIESNTLIDANAIFSRTIINGAIRNNLSIKHVFKAGIGYFLTDNVASENVEISGNKIYGEGISIWPGSISSYSFNRLIIADNIIKSLGRFGIQAQFNSWTTNVIVKENVIHVDYSDNSSFGIFLSGSQYAIVHGNIIYINNTNYEARGLYINGCRYVIISRNYIYGSGNPLTGYFGIYWGNHYIFDNVLPSVVFDSSYPPNPVFINRNIQYVTENSGVATINANNTRVTVNHGLRKAPTKVLITPLAQPPGKLWVENITSTSFDIVTDTAPTADLQIAWYAEV